MRDHAPLPSSTTCVIAGCGPAGAMLGLLLARAGVDVLVLEKHPDFFRDFRGDTVHASTLQVLDDLDLIDGFDRLPQQRTTHIDLLTDDGPTPMGDFSELPGRFRHLSMVPQWDFLSFLTEEAARYPGFALHREVEVVGLVEDDGDVVRGVRCRTAAGDQVVHADLVVAADGRNSVTRAAAGLVATEYGSPLDVLWYRVSRAAGDPSGTFLRVAPGALLPMIDRRTYWQGAYTIPKGGFVELRARGIEAFRSTLRACLPFLGDRVDDVDLGGRRLPRGPRQPARLLVAARAAVHRRCRARDVARSAGWASTSRSRTPSRRRTSWPGRCSTGGSGPPTCGRCNAAGSCPPGSPNACSSVCSGP